MGLCRMGFVEIRTCRISKAFAQQGLVVDLPEICVVDGGWHCSGRPRVVELPRVVDLTTITAKAVIYLKKPN